MRLHRASGILLHPTSLPGPHGIGDLGQEAKEFVSFLKSAGQAYWQILPLGPTGYGDSPYQSFSAFAGNTNLISPELLVEDGLLNRTDVDPPKELPADRVDYGRVIEWKAQLLEKAYQSFQRSSAVEIRSAFESFLREAAFWLDDYALFRAIKETQKPGSWLEWEPALKNREHEAVLKTHEDLLDLISRHKFFQFLFFRQWHRLKSFANGEGIRIIGDIPIFVAFDSADVWSRPKDFKLNQDGSPEVVSGVPPDYFSKTGQLWGNPIYRWKQMRSEGFRWWIERFRFALKMVDIVRIDHFRGFAASWEVPGKDETAEHGEWVEVPGGELFYELFREFGEIPVIAEDLGVITEDVESLRDRFGFPGMKILQYAFGGDANNPHLPHNFTPNTVVYTGTHDNDTTVGWYEGTARKKKKKSDHNSREREYFLEYLDSDGEKINWDLIRGAFASVADTAIVPLQDVLGLDNEARMNLPATESGNWQWRFRKGDLTEKHARLLRKMAKTYGRDTRS